MNLSLKHWFRKWVFAGASPDESEKGLVLPKHTVVVTNLIALTLSVFGIPFSLLFYNDPKGIVAVFTLITLASTTIYWNHRKYHDTARANLILCTSFGVMLLFSYLAPANYKPGIAPKLVLLSMVSIPLLIFDYREKAGLIVGCGLVITANFLYEPLHELIARTDHQLAFPASIYIHFATIFGFLTLIASFIYFKHFTLADEKRILQLIADQQKTEDELRNSNAELIRMNQLLSEINQRTADQVILKAESELRYQALADATMEGVLMHINGRIVGCNRAFGELFGYTREEVLGKNLTDFVRKDDRPIVKNIFLYHLSRQAEAVGRRKDGAEFEVLLLAQPHFNENQNQIAIFRDISIYKEMENRLRQSQANLRALIDNTQNPIWSLDRDFRITLTNKSFQLLYSQAYGHWLQPGDSFLERLRPASKGLWKTMFLKSVEGATQRLEFQFLPEITHELLINPLYDDMGEIQGVSVFAQDITENKKAEAERLRMQESLSESRSNLNALIENTRELIWSVNTEYEIILMNSLVRETLFRRDGTPMQEGDNILKNVPRDKVNLWEKYYDRALSGEAFRIEHNFYDRLTCEVAFSPIINERFEITGVAVYAHDISERKQYEEELQANNRQLALTVQELQTTQRQLVVNEKLAAIGQLVASIAHEINSPLGAIMAFNRLNLTGSEELVAEIPSLIRQLPDELMPAFLQVIGASDDMITEISSREERQYRSRLQEQLEYYQIPEARGLAAKLVRMNIFKVREGFLPLLNHPDAKEWLSLATKLTRIKINCIGIQTASERANHIVKALKNYSAIQLSDTVKPTNIEDTIEVALAIFQSKIKRDIKLVKDYTPNLPAVEVFPEEISQVWAILISNAIYAMDGKGTLTIKTWLEKQDELPICKVSVRDDGTGIAPEHLPRIFEPFFTTKPEGEGAGLGLDICRKILEKHHADISVSSQPGDTIFTVGLPVSGKV
jgi:PAS domain S-box-containing protein